MQPSNLASKKSPPAPSRLLVPEGCFIALDRGAVQIMTADGEIESAPLGSHTQLLQNQTYIFCNAPFLQRRLNKPDLSGFDILELYAFFFPVLETVPTLKGLCENLDMAYDDENPALCLYQLTQHILSTAQNLLGAINPIEQDYKRRNWAAIARAMKGWGWQASVLALCGEDIENLHNQMPDAAGLRVWKNLPEWSEHAPEPPATSQNVSPDESEIRLNKWLKNKGGQMRPAQIDYARSICHAFQPRPEEMRPRITFAEAGTGIGKTLGYLAPATIWAEKNDSPVWISTYTKNLQKQISQELGLQFTDPIEKDNKVVIRKGRENYLCLLNFEEMANAVPTTNHRAIPIMAGLLARWIQETKDGDIRGGDFPGWLTALMGEQTIHRLVDKRGECIHSACSHYHKCFVEKSVRKSRRAQIVIANHALVMIQNAYAAEKMGDENAESQAPTRYIFDEGHHLFDAADSAFACHLSGRETTELKRWLMGNSATGLKSSRRRGLRARMDYIPDDDGQYAQMIEAITIAAHCLPDNGWLGRIAKGQGSGSCEMFFAGLRGFIMAQGQKQDPFYSIEVSKHEIPAQLLELAFILQQDLIALKKPLMALIQRLEHDLIAKQEEWESDIRRRAEAMVQSLKRRSLHGLDGWIDMLAAIEDDPIKLEALNFLDWFELVRIEGQDIDVGFYRHSVDPMKPFVKVIEPHIHGMAITSATLSAKNELSLDLSGLSHFEKTPPVELFRARSPYDYPAQSKILIVNDLNGNDPQQLAQAYFNLFKGAQGGGLGIFTAIQRLKIIHELILPMMNAAHIPIYAQHLDGLSTSSLIDIFKSETDSCLIGTDALRDGVDIPGESLRLIVFDRVPWPRPTLLHKARRNLFGARDYDDDQTRMKLKQAYGRLIRSGQDKGVFIILDNRLPSRLLDAFPADVQIERIGIKQAIETVAQFLQKKAD